MEKGITIGMMVNQDTKKSIQKEKKMKKENNILGMVN